MTNGGKRPARGFAAGWSLVVSTCRGGLKRLAIFFSNALFAVTVPDAAPGNAPSSEQDAAARPVSDSLEVIRKFAETYAQRTGTYFCSDPGVTAVVLEGLARHKDELGGALCPCRHYEDKQAEVAQAFWNCPCVPMRERKECHCMLFLTEDNPFRGEQQTISLEEVRALIAG